MRRTTVLSLLIALVGLPSGSAAAAPADLSAWLGVSYPGDGSAFAVPGDWSVSADGLTVSQDVNGAPTFFVAPTPAEGQRITATFTSTSTDNDFFGVALGLDPTEISDPDADYLLIDWKKSDQDIDWFGGGGTVTGRVGLAVSRVQGIPVWDELWGHADQLANPAGGVAELARASDLGGTGWEQGTPYAFEIEYTETSLVVRVDGVVALDLIGSFPTGPFAIYNFSQPGVASSAITFEALNEPPTVLDGGAPDVTVYEGMTATTTGMFVDPDGDAIALTCDGLCDGFVDLGGGVWNWMRTEPDGPFDHVVAVTASDGLLESIDQFTVTVVNVAPVIESLAAIPLTVAVDDPVALDTSFTDPGLEDTHTVSVDWGDGTGDDANVDQGAGSGTATGAHAYGAAGTHTIEVTVTDDDGGSDTKSVQVFVFDPNSFVTGGGWIGSPEGVVLASPGEAGKGTFGFVVRYDRTGQIRGNLEFQVHKQINLHAREFVWLEITGGIARFSGAGTVNGEPGYEFSVVATDERLAGTEADLFRLSISKEGEVILDGSALPSEGLPIVGRGIQVHRRR